MRFLIAANRGDNKPQAVQPDDATFDAYMKFNEEMQKAGVLVASEGLNPAGIRARVAVKNGKRTVVDGPVTESKELVGGFYVIDVKTKEEALAWAQRCPVGLGSDDVLDIFQLTGAEDLPPEIVERIRKVAPTWSATFAPEKKRACRSSCRCGWSWVARRRAARRRAFGRPRSRSPRFRRASCSMLAGVKTLPARR